MIESFSTIEEAKEFTDAIAFVKGNRMKVLKRAWSERERLQAETGLMMETVIAYNDDQDFIGVAVEIVNARMLGVPHIVFFVADAA